MSTNAFFELKETSSRADVLPSTPYPFGTLPLAYVLKSTLLSLMTFV